MVSGRGAVGHGHPFRGDFAKDQQEDSHGRDGNGLGMGEREAIDESEAHGRGNDIDQCVAYEDGGEQARRELEHRLGTVRGKLIAVAQLFDVDRVE